MYPLLMLLKNGVPQSKHLLETSTQFLKPSLLDYVDTIYENTSKLNLSRLQRVYKQILRFALDF